MTGATRAVARAIESARPPLSEGEPAVPAAGMDHARLERWCIGPAREVPRGRHAGDGTHRERRHAAAARAAHGEPARTPILAHLYGRDVAWLHLLRLADHDARAKR